MEPVGVPASVKDAAGELVYNLHLAFFDDVLCIPMEEAMRPKGLSKVMYELEALFVEEGT